MGGGEGGGGEIGRGERGNGWEKRELCKRGGSDMWGIKGKESVERRDDIGGGWGWRG